MSDTGGKYAGLLEALEILDARYGRKSGLVGKFVSVYSDAAEAIKSLEAELAEANKVKLDADGFGAMAKRYAAHFENWLAVGLALDSRAHLVKLFRGAIMEAGEQYRDHIKSLEAERDAAIATVREMVRSVGEMNEKYSQDMAKTERLIDHADPSFSSLPSWPEIIKSPRKPQYEF